MGRIKLAMPADYLFSTEIEIRISDINYGGHLANDAVLSIAHEARLRFLAASNYSEKNIEGYGLIMTDAAIVFKSEAFYGDRLVVEIAVDDISRLGFDLFYRLKNSITKQDVAFVKTGMAFFNYELHKIASTPENFFTKFSKQTM
jgi:acyl-CoA thioesterase FadM